MSVDKSDLIQLQSLDAAMVPRMRADCWPRLNPQLTHLFCIDFKRDARLLSQRNS